MEKYYLITIRRNSGDTFTFIEKGYTLYNAFLMKRSQYDTIANHINNNSIIFSQEVTVTDYNIYQKNIKA